MKHKKSMIIMMLAIFLFAIAAASASDVNDTAIASGDDNQIELSTNDEINEDNLQTHEYNQSIEQETLIIGTDNGTYEALKTKISEASAGSTVTLENDYLFDDLMDLGGEGINIFNPIIIDGKGHKIDAQNKTRIFKILVNDVVIKNITFINGYHANRGGAIYWSSTNANISDCYFVNNTALDGGANYFEKEIIDSNINATFNDNQATSMGGANYFYNSLTRVSIVGNYINNKAKYSGGANHFHSSVNNINITGNYTNNTSNSSGGANEFYESVTNLILQGNYANNKEYCGLGGGANRICGQATNIKIIGNYTNNTSQGSGGANFFYGSSTTNLFIIGNYINNIAVDLDGGANRIYGQATNITIIGNYTNNTSKEGGGGANQFYNTAINILILGNYTNNTANGGGGANKFSSVTNLTIQGQYTNNKDYGLGGGANRIAGKAKDITIIGNYTNNTSNNSGGANDFQDSVTNLFLLGNYMNNNEYGGLSGGANRIYGQATNITIIGNYTNNTSQGSGGANFFYGSSTTNLFIIGNYINNIAVSLGGGANRIYGQATNITIIGNYTNNTAKEGGGGANLFFDSVTNLTLQGNYAHNTAYGNMGGGANLIYKSAKYVTIIGDYINNTATGDGGANQFSDSVTNLTLQGNYAHNTAYGNMGGGANWISDRATNIKIIGNYTNNAAKGDGGANRIYGSAKYVIGNYINNTARGDGGAIWIVSGTFENCNFINNSARYGGAIVLDETGNVTNCDFTGNNASTGSAIYFLSSSATKTVSNSRFLNNKANAEALEVNKNNNTITITFTGKDNLLNAIYAYADVSFTNVTYWSAKGIANTDSSTPVKSNKEAGQNITVEIYDSDNKLVENVTFITNDNGQAKYDFIKLNNGTYKYKVYHAEDSYYTYANETGDFTLDSDLGDFQRLQSYINGADENLVLTLFRDHTYTIGKDTITEGIVIDKPLTINGNGHTINALGKTRIFKITAANVVLNNITFTNANINNNGGAIYFDSSGTVINCNFTNNTATTNGGAIYFDEGSNGRIINCNFADNSATNGSGGAIVFAGAGNVTNCNFTNNTAPDGDGGAIKMDSGTVTNCNFNNNTATNGGGGAIVFAGAGNVTNCNFTDNRASFDGGALYFVDVSNVTNCNFTDNSASGNGGAVYFWDDGNLINCNFTNNTATDYNSMGGSVYFAGDGNVTNCDFTDNAASGDGGAIYIGSGSVENCNFTNNQATEDGGAIYIDSGSVENCNFTNNQATEDGGAVWMFSGTVTNCNFTNNSANSGGAIWFYSTSATKTVSNSRFLNNRANAEALEVTKNDNNITIIFTGQNNLLNAIYSNGEVNFTNVVYWSANGIANTDSSTPSRSKNETGQNITMEIYDSNDGFIEKVTLVTGDNGQAKYEYLKLSNGDYKYKVYHFEDCYYTYAENNGTFTLDSDLGDFNRLQICINGSDENSVLTLCRDYTFTTGADENLVDGIVIDRPLTINGNGHKINALHKARIFNVKANNVVLNNIAFENAHTTGDGGAVYFNHNGTVTYCNFTNNTASGDGGAICFDQYYYDPTTGNVANCNFADNTGDEGGAIHIYSGNIIDCNFTHNSASQGGAIYFDYYSSSTGNIENCNFADNTAIVGGAVYSDNPGNLTNCNFTNNTASSCAAACLSDNYNISNCNFVNNTGTFYGALYFYYSPIINIEECSFIGNDAYSGSAIYFYQNSSIKRISNSIFLNNSAGIKEFQVTQNENNITITFIGLNNLLNAIYSNGDVNFTNVTYWNGAKGIANTGNSTLTPSDKIAGQNISIYGIVDEVILNTTNATDDDGKIVLKYGGGDYILILSHDADSHYWKYENEYTNMNLYVNVTSLTTHNKTVNITAKSNIRNDIIQGKLKFFPQKYDTVIANYTGNGTWWALYTFDDYGSYNVRADYSVFDVTVKVGTISIKDYVPINASDISIFYGDAADVVADLPEAINGQNITIAVNGTSVNATVMNGKAKASFTDLDAGEYAITVTYLGDDRNFANSTTAKLTVNKAKTQIAAKSITATYNKNKKLTITLKDANGKAISGARVTVKIKKSKTYTTDKNGQIKISTKGLAPKKYTVKITFNGTTNYIKSAKSVKITVKKAKPKITAKKKTYKAKAKTKKLTITLKDNKGKPIKKVKVRLIVNKVGKKKTKAKIKKKNIVKTNKKGKATFKVERNKKGKYIGTIIYKGDKYYKRTTKKVKITLK